MYKYSEAQYVESALQNGTVKIGTLYDFRRSEHKEGIADANEGVNRYFYHQKHYSGMPYDNPLDLPALERFKLFSGDPGHGAVFENNTLRMKNDSPDAFIFCFSKELSLKVMEEFDGADACYEILNPMKFFKRITKALNRQIQKKDPKQEALYQGWTECIYMPKTLEWNGRNEISPINHKEEEFKGQKEMRAVWHLKDFNRPVEPEIITDDWIPNYITRRF